MTGSRIRSLTRPDTALHPQRPRATIVINADRQTGTHR